MEEGLADSAEAGRLKEKKLYLIKCSDCGAEDTVNFKPQGDKPVFCKVCFAKRHAR